MQDRYPPLIERGDISAARMNLVIVCEHASNVIPLAFKGLGLDATAQQSHIAWDPGALGVAQEMRRLLGGSLVAGSVSRLLYDCNRPPEAPSAIPDRSEVFDIPGNQNLSLEDRAARERAIYVPFRAALAEVLDEHRDGIMVTVHSFTPIYHGIRRDCEIGVLHDSDSRLADAMLTSAPPNFPYKLERNVPYSASDGVTHTLKTTAMTRGLLNVMLEIRNDLIAATLQQITMANHIVALLSAATSKLKE